MYPEKRKEVPQNDFCDLWLVNVFFQGLKEKKKKEKQTRAFIELE